MNGLILPESGLILPSTRRLLDFGVRTHRLSEEMVILGLVEQLMAEYGQSWYAIATFGNGKAFCFGRSEASPAPNGEVFNMMLACALGLNRNLHHDGCWIVVWHDKRLSFLWRDGDGDAAFIEQIDEPWPRIRMWSSQEFGERAEAAWQQWREMIFKLFDRRPEETIMRAQGQQSRGSVH